MAKSANSAGSPARVNAQYLLTQASEYWQEGNWQALCDLIPDSTSANAVSLPDGATGEVRGKLSAYIGAALIQLGKVGEGRAYLRLARAEGVPKRELAQLLMHCMHTQFARIAALRDDMDTARNHITEALILSGGNRRGLTHKVDLRCAQELRQLGLLVEAGQLLKQEISTLEKDPSADLNNRISVLQSEIATLEAALVSNQASRNTASGQSYSQLGQDLWVLEKLGYKRAGFFVEFGATDGILLSNSYLLESQYDWHGLLAEPNPQYFAQLRSNRHCTVTNSCIGPTTGAHVEFVLAKEYGGISTFIDKDKHFDRRNAYADLGNTIEVETISLHDFLTQHDAPRQIDYLSMDTEGSELSILETFPFEQWDIRCITVEHNHGPNRDPIRSMLRKRGYVLTEAKWDDWFYLP